MNFQAAIKYAYALELRPRPEYNNFSGNISEIFALFMLPVKEIKPTVEETWAGVEAMCMEIKHEFDLEPGE